VLATDYADALAQLGYHRHPDWWKSDHELAPIEHDRRGKGRQRVGSERDRDAEGRGRIADNAALLAARRAAAAEGRDVEWASPAVDVAASVIASVAVTGGGQ
jgi:hypothetical protein